MLVKRVIQAGGSITPLIIPSELTGGTGLTNPSIYNDNGKLILNLRHVQYTLYHAENQQQFPCLWGPLAYLNPEDDITLRTVNYLCHLNEKFEIENYNRVDTSKLDVTPVWEFIGLEDARVVRWNDKLYLSGVRRDTKTNGEGRMELSEIVNNKEISRFRIPAPGENNSYCEKNWMPIIDMPFHYVKWSNPVEIVKVDVDAGTCETVFNSGVYQPGGRDIRGGSQVITLGDYRIALTHEVDLYFNEIGQKDAQYYHRFIIWDKSWNIVHTTEEFKFLDAMIEFSCGMCEYNNEILITFGFQDSTAFLLRIPMNFFNNLLGIVDNNKQKFNNICPVTYVSFITETKRRSQLESELDAYNILDRKAFISTKETDTEHKITGQWVEQIEPPALGCTISHLKAIKNWYTKTTDSEYALFLEDDVTLQTAYNWNFTWEEFINELPSDWDCVQLTCIKENLSEVKLREREWDDWSVTGYIITRKYAKLLIDTYFKEDGTIHLYTNEGTTYPCIENVIYTLGKVYCIPLLVENVNFDSTFYGKTINEPHKQDHVSSANFVTNWWKQNGNQTNIKELCKIY